MLTGRGKSKIMAATLPKELLAPQYINGIYIPSGLLVFGTIICKREWVPYAVLMALVFSGWKLWNNRTCQVPRDEAQ